MMTRGILVGKLHFATNVDRSDLLDPKKTTDHLIAMMMTAADERIKSGDGPILVTCVNTDHGPEPSFWTHGHKNGDAIDIYVSGNVQKFLHDCIYGNHLCTKVGLGGVFRGMIPYGETNETLVFEDNDQDHIHLQTA